MVEQSEVTEIVAVESVSLSLEEIDKAIFSQKKRPVVFACERADPFGNLMQIGF
jgi:hypothetical protein